MAANDVVITHALRSPYVKSGGSLQNVSAVELGRQVVQELLTRSEVPTEEIDEVVLGCAGQPGDAANIARVIALRARIPRPVPAVTVQRNCASGMESIASAYRRIKTKEADVVLAGGVESMSNYPLLFPDSAREIFMDLQQSGGMWDSITAGMQFRPKHFTPVVGLLQGLTDPVCGLNMGETGEVLAREFGISRGDQDAFALQSHEKATRARAAGKLAAEISPVFAGDDAEPIVDDNGIRENQSMEALARLKPVFDRKFGTVTAGNACPISDGAVALLVMRESKAKALGYKPIGRIKGFAFAGLDPARMGLGPVFATAKLLDQLGMALKDVDRIELNEAFAAQVLACVDAFKSKAFAKEHLGRSKAVGTLSLRKLNVNGGAIALGHPVGSTGARLVTTLLAELNRKGGGLGLATLCIGGGQGGAMIVEGTGHGS